MELADSSRTPSGIAVSITSSLVLATVMSVGLGGCDRRTPKPPTPAVAVASADVPRTATPVPEPVDTVVALSGQPVPQDSNSGADQAPPRPVAGLSDRSGNAMPLPPATAARPVPRQHAVAASHAAAKAPLARLGEVMAIEPIRERPKGSGVGAVLGGVLGAVVGNQFGHGNGRTAMTVVGAAGGAVTGNNVERNVNTRVVAYRVQVRLAGGTSQVYEETHLDGLRVGDRVRVDGRHLRRA